MTPLSNPNYTLKSIDFDLYIDDTSSRTYDNIDKTTKLSFSNIITEISGK